MSTGKSSLISLISSSSTPYRPLHHPNLHVFFFHLIFHYSHILLYIAIYPCSMSLAIYPYIPFYNPLYVACMRTFWLSEPDSETNLPCGSLTKTHTHTHLSFHGKPSGLSQNSGHYGDVSGFPKSRGTSLKFPTIGIIVFGAYVEITYFWKLP